VEGVVHVRVARPARLALLDHLGDLAPRTHEAEVDVGRRPAEGHAPRVVLGAEGEAGLVGLGADPVGEMGVGLDPAGDHDPSGGVDDPGAVGRQRAGQRQRGDALAGDADVPVADTPGSHDPPAPDHEVQRHAANLARSRAPVNATCVAHFECCPLDYGTASWNGET
jgi:hypothetical protein